MFAAASAAALLLAAVGRLLGIDALTLIGGYGVVFIGLGSAPFQLRDDMRLEARLTASMLVGFTVLLCVGALMADLPLWYPVIAAVVVCLPAGALHVLGVRRWLHSRSTGAKHSIRPRYPERVGGSHVATGLLKSASPRERLSLALTAVGTLLWLVPVITTRAPQPPVGGLLPIIGPVWYAGLALVIIAFAVGRSTDITAAAATTSFAVASTLSPALVYATARAGTAGKQMQLTQYVLTNHHIDVTTGIYQAYSAMFSGLAWLFTLLHINGISGPHSLLQVATYWPVLIALMRLAALRLLAGRLLTTTGRQWTAVMLVFLVDSLGNDYFSPQSIGYVMAIGVLAFAVRGRRPLDSRTTLWLLIAAGCALAPTHELTPYILGGALVVLAIFGQTPQWTFLPIVLPALAWLGLVHKSVSQNFNFAQLFDLSNFAPPATAATPGLERLPVVGLQSHTLLAALLILIVTGAVGFLAHISQRKVWAYALCPTVGLALIAINPYGNEGIFRATLFAIPWMAVLAASVPRPFKPLRRMAVFTSGVGVYLLCLLATFLVATYSMDAANMLYASDMAVSQTMQSFPPRNAFVLNIGSGNNPLASLPFLIDYTALEWDDVADHQIFRTLHPTPLNLLALTDEYGIVAAQQGATFSSPMYIVWSLSDLRHAQAYGLQTPRQLRTWLRLLEHSSYYRLVERVRQTYLFRLRR